MQSHFHAQDAGSLEAEFQRVIRQQNSPAAINNLATRSRLKQVGVALLNFLTGAQTMSIRPKASKDGSVRWIAYDPTTHTRRVFDSELALRTWLEERYHQ